HQGRGNAGPKVLPERPIQAGTSRRLLLLLLVSIFLIGCHEAAPPPDASPHTASPRAASPYAGAATSAIKALSDAEVQGLLGGAGMGFAKAAELNSYPGPKHVLELAEPLALTDEQRQQTEAIRAAMLAEAVPLGALLLEKEQALDALFADGNADAASMQALLAEIGALQGQLRAVHLQAHIEQRTVLTDEQVHQYNRLRGYHAGAGHEHHHSASS